MVMVLVMHKINKMFGIIDTNSTLQIISADWIEEYYDDQYFALLIRKNLNHFGIKEKIGSGIGLDDDIYAHAGLGFGYNWREGLNNEDGSGFAPGYDETNSHGYGDGWGDGNGFGNGSGIQLC